MPTRLFQSPAIGPLGTASGATCARPKCPMSKWTQSTTRGAAPKSQGQNCPTMRDSLSTPPHAEERSSPPLLPSNRRAARLWPARHLKLPPLNKPTHHPPTLRRSSSSKSWNSRRPRPEPPTSLRGSASTPSTSRNLPGSTTIPGLPPARVGLRLAGPST